MLRSTLFLIYMIASCLAMFAAFWWLLLLGKRGAFFGAWMLATHAVWAAKHILGITYEVKGEIPSYSAIYASRHESAWETFFLQTIIKNPVFILKRELKWIPLFGLFMIVAGYIGVNRSKGSKALKKMVKDASRAIKDGKNIIIFPEGTRLKTGQKGDIKPGIVAIYSMSELPIIPVSLNSGKCWGKNSFIKKSGKITVTIHEPVQKGLSKKDFSAKLESLLSS